MSHWMRTGLAVLLWCIFALPGGPAMAQEATDDSAAEPAETLDTAARTRIDALRSRLRLGNSDLAALGCTRVNAKEALGALLTWYRTNGAALATAEKAEATAKAALDAALQKVRIGPRNETLLARLPTLKSAYANALRQRYDLVKTIVPALEAKLSASQKSLWRAARRNGGLPARYRYVPEITAAQAKALRVAQRTRVRLLAAAKTGAEMKAAEAGMTAAEQRTLSASQRETIATTKANLRQLRTEVEAASRETFPATTEAR